MASMGFSALIGAIYFKSYTFSFKILSGYLIYTFIQQVIGLWLAELYSNNAVAAHVFVFVSLIFYYSFLVSFGLKDIVKRILFISTLFSIALSILSVLFIQGPLEYPTFNLGIFALTVIFQSFLFFNEMLDKPSNIPILRDTKFLIVGIFVLFYMQSLFVFPVLAFVGQHFGRLEEYSYLIYILNMIFYLLLSAVLIFEIRKLSR